MADAQLAGISVLVGYQAAQVDLTVATCTLIGAARIGWAPARPATAPAAACGAASGPASPTAG